LQNSPASKAGILPGDLVMQVAGRGVSDVPEMLALVAALKPGESANIGLLRNGKTLDLKVVPGVRPPKN
jgi:S1-C subfamily serine protease